MKINGSQGSNLSKAKASQSEKTAKQPRASKSAKKDVKKTSKVQKQPQDQGQLVDEFVADVAKKKFGQFSGSSIMATAIKLVSGKLGASDDAVTAIKKKSRRA